MISVNAPLALGWIFHPVRSLPLNSWTQPSSARAGAAKAARNSASDSGRVIGCVVIGGPYLVELVGLMVPYFFGSGGFGSTEASGAAVLRFGVTSASTSPKAQPRPPSRIFWNIGFSHTSSRWPIDV